MVPRLNTPRLDERGSVAPVYLGAILIIVTLIGFCVDLSGAWLIHTARTNDLAASRDQVASAPVALVIKNADDPGMETALQVAAALRANGFEGELKVWCHESPMDDISAFRRNSRRVLAWTAQTLQEYTPPFSASFGMQPIKVAATITSSSVPYSGGTTWRPDKDGDPVGNGVYVFEANSVNPTYTPLGSLNDPSWPASIKAAIDERLRQIETNEV